jgi:hypothetical protein
MQLIEPFYDGYDMPEELPDRVTVVLLDERENPERPLPYLLANALCRTQEQAQREGFTMRLIRVAWRPANSEAA